MEKQKVNVISIGQKGGQTAHTIVNNFQSPRRIISDEASQLMIVNLKRYSDKRFKIYVSNNDPEGINLANRLKTILVHSGWVESGFIYNLAGSYPEGIHIEVGGEPTKADIDFANLLLNLTDFKINTNKNTKVEDLSIVIGPNP